MNISSAAERTNLPPKTIRYYEDIGLIKPGRAQNGYRAYSREDVHRLQFLQRSRSLGFTIEECRTLLSLYNDEDRASADVKRIAREKMKKVDEKIAELQSLRTTLKVLVENCHGDQRPDCPILDDLAGRKVEAL